MLRKTGFVATLTVIPLLVGCPADDVGDDEVGDTSTDTTADTTDTSTDTTTDTTDTTTGDPFMPVEALLEFVGGTDALQAMTGFSSVASGTRSLAGEGLSPGDPAVAVGTFDATTSVEFASDSARIDHVRTSLFLGGAELVSTEFYVGPLGYIDGEDNLFVPGETNAPMLSTRWASGRKQMALLHPHILILDVLAGDRTANPSDALLDGCEGVVEVSDTVSPILLCVAADGELLRAETMVNDFLLRDSSLVVTYTDWSGAGVQFPGSVSIAMRGEEVHVETRAVEVDPMFAAGFFDLLDGGSFDANLASFGDLSHQFFQGFAALGIANDAQLLFVLPQELTPGVWHLLGGSHNSLAIEQENGIVIVEAPNYPERADAILEWADQTFPNKPVTHVISTHHHEDHSAGLRAFVAAGVTVVIHEAAEQFFANEVFVAPSTISPDALAFVPMAAVIEPVGAEPLVLDDALHPITLSQLPNGHAGDMILIHVAGDQNIVFESDLYNPGFGGSALNPVFAQELLDAINAGEATDVIAGGHVGSAPVSELEDFLMP